MQRATSEFIRLVKAKVEDEKVSFSEAMLRVARENPQLCSAYREETTRPGAVDITPTPERQELPQGPATAELMRRAKARSQEAGVSFTEAFKSVAGERPVLASEYRKEVTGSKF
jgi:hypothetical protein